MGYLFVLILGVVGYFALQPEAPTPQKPWRAYATSADKGQPEWLSWGPGYATKDECQFNADNAVGNGYYRKPAGCVYNGYQNSTVLSLVNSIIAPNVWKCVIRRTKRDKYDDPVFEVILRDYPGTEGDGWKCL